MPSKFNARKMESVDGDSDASNSNDNVSTKPKNKTQPRSRSVDTSTSTTNEPSSASTSSVGARHPRALPVAATATAAAPTVPLSGKEPRRPGFREQFLQQLRVMLDRESQNEDATVHWSTDGNSFIITAQTQFEEEIIPTYFGNPIVFASFLRKLLRWGFVRVSSNSKRTGRYEFSSPNFKRMDSRSTPAAASGAATTTNEAVNDGGGASIQFRKQQQQQQQVMAQINHQPMPTTNQLPRHADASAIADLISNIQRRTQQPSTSNPQPRPNQYTIQRNIADINKILQNITGSNQYQPIAGQNSVPNHQPMPNHASQLNGNNNLQSLQQWQHLNATMNLLNSALQSLARGPTSSAQAMGQYPPPSDQSNAVHALMSLSGMLPQSPPLNTTPAASGMLTAALSQPSDMAQVLSLSLLQMLQRFVEEENQRRDQVDAIQNALLATIGSIFGQGFHNNNTAQPQQVGAPPRSRQSLVSNHNNNVAQPNQVGAPYPSAGSNTQANSISAILHAAQRGDVTARPEENTLAQKYGPAHNNNDNRNENDIEEASEEYEHHPTKKRKSSPDDEDQYDADGDRRQLE